MNLRVGRKENMSAEMVDRQMNAPKKSAKPGELSELFQALKEDHMSPEIAAELADIAYLGLQPEANEEDRLDNPTKQLLLVGIYGFKMDWILNFCIIKYITRLEKGDEANYKELEFKILGEYLDLHPEIKNIWENTTPPQVLNIGLHVHGDEWEIIQ